MKEQLLLSTQGLRHLRSSLLPIQDGSNVPMAHKASFGMMVWDRLMCYEESRDRSIKFLSLTMQYADVFGYLIRVLAQAEPKLKEYRCREGDLLLKTVLPHIVRSQFGQRRHVVRGKEEVVGERRPQTKQAQSLP